MAPSSVTDAEAQWLAQVAAMKAAIAELKLPSHAPNGDTTASSAGEDDDDFDLSSVSGETHDVWDFISDSELDELGLDSGDLMDGTDGVDQEPPYGPQWFLEKCTAVSAHRDGLPAETLQLQILEALKSNQREDELQSLLTDLVGFDDLEFVIELISHRDEIAVAMEQAEQHADDQPTGRLLSKAERESRLRKQDLLHKTAALGPATAKEPQYPHVYKSFSAGNSLNHAGKRYALPVGSERLQFDKYEEYAIPAGKPGTLWPGQKLVTVKELDGLCRNTFKGYKTLNRMQSLVYPVAYKSSENMLICAPTGAVSSMCYWAGDEYHD